MTATGQEKGVAIVTGGSRGIGASCSMLLAKAGYAVVVNYTRNAEAAAVVVEAIRAGGGTAVAAKGDVGVEADVTALFAAADALGTLKALVNNAGVIDVLARVDEITGERLERMFRTNVFSAFFCAREAVKRMSSRHGGTGGGIVNISSVTAQLGSPGWYVDYAASKGAIDTFTRGLALEVATEGIRVNGIRPGVIATDIHQSGGAPDRVAELRPLLPMKREGSPDEVAEAVVWLLSAAASYVTGTTINVSGGR